MTFLEAQLKAQQLFGPGAVLERSMNGNCRVMRPLTDEEKASPPAGAQITKHGYLVLGTGASWLAAMRYAAKPVLEAAQAKDRVERAQREQEMRELEREMGQFGDFLREKFAADFEAWKATGGKRTSAAEVTDGDVAVTP